MSGPGTIVEGLGEGTFYLLLRGVGRDGGRLAAPINPAPERPKVVELADGFYQITDPASVMAKYGHAVNRLRREHNLH